MGFAVHEVFNGGGNPYGTSYTSDHRVDGPDETTLMVARAQGARLARVAAAKRMRVESLPAELEERLLEAFAGGAAREAGRLTAKTPPRPVRRTNRRTDGNGNVDVHFARRGQPVAASTAIRKFGR
jgi:hypothetical protein